MSKRKDEAFGEMNLAAQVGILAQITTRDEAGRHFTAAYDDGDLEALEAAGLLEIGRPVHEATGIFYSQEYWAVAVTADGIELVEAYPEYHPEG